MICVRTRAMRSAIAALDNTVEERAIHIMSASRRRAEKASSNSCLWWRCTARILRFVRLRSTARRSRDFGAEKPVRRTGVASVGMRWNRTTACRGPETK